MELSYRLRIYPTILQIVLLAQFFGAARWLWNACLSWRSCLYQKFGERVTGVDFSRELTWLKKLEVYSWLAKVPATVLTQVLRDQDKAFSNFFAKRARYPKYKKRQSVQAIRFQIDQRVAANYFRAGELLRLPGLGSIKVRWSRIPGGIPKMVTIGRDAAGRYFVSFMCVEKNAVLPETGHGIGIDLGIKDVFVDSDGNKSGNPRHLNKKLRRLKRYQRQLARCKKGSRRRRRAIHRVARQHARITDSRRDWLQKQTTAIIQRADVIALEDLHVKGMMRNHHLARAIGDVGMGEIRRQLEYKAEWYGRKIIVIDRFEPTSKVCSECGHLMDVMALSIREWTCPNCGVIHDRDINAARNILSVATGGRPGSHARRGRHQPGAGGDDVAGMRASDESRTVRQCAEVCQGWQATKH
ncbi:transposase [Gammaproteobacteria bacterium]